jgi:dipeptidyl aminopeptidase/acylaminoacyl peptidase
VRLEELFSEAAQLGEPPQRPDMLALIGHARQTRARRRLLVGAPVALTLLVGLVATFVPLGQSAERVPGTAPPAAAPGGSPPPKFYGSHHGRLVQVDTAGGAQKDLGAGFALTVRGDGLALVAQATLSTCVANLRWQNLRQPSALPPPPVAEQGTVTDLAFSPDGQYVAYAIVPRERLSEDPGFLSCQNQADLVIRNVSTGTERRWTADPNTATGTLTPNGMISSLSWRSDGRFLAFQTAPRGGHVSLMLLDVNSPQKPVSQITYWPLGRRPNHGPGTCQESLPTYAGLLGLDLETCSVHGRSLTYELLDTGSGATLTTFPTAARSLHPDPTGQFLLVTSVSPGNVSRIALYDLHNLRRPPRELADDLTAPTW